MATRFVVAPKSDTEAINAVADGVNQANLRAYLTQATSLTAPTAAQVVGGYFKQTGSPGAYNMTMPTAAKLVAAIFNAQVGSTFEFFVFNLGNGAITVVTATGLTLAGNIVIPANALTRFTGIVTTATVGSEAVNIIGPGVPAVLADSLYSTAALQSAAIPAVNCAGAKNVGFENTGTTPATLTTDTAVAIVAAIPNAFVGQTYDLEIRNSSGSANTATIAGGTGVTMHGTLTIAQNVTRYFKVVLTSLTAVDIYSMGISAAAV